jgi:hypothetical protein
LLLESSPVSLLWQTKVSSKNKGDFEKFKELKSDIQATEERLVSEVECCAMTRCKDWTRY